MGLYVQKGEMGKDIVNFAAAPGNLYVHLLIVNSIAVPSAFFGDNGLKMRILVTLITGKVNVATLFNTVWQSIHNIEQPLQFYFFFSNRSVNFRP